MFSRTMGLMFQRKLKPEQGIILIAQEKSILHTSIHSFFVFFPFTAIWLDEKKRVLEKKDIKPFQAFLSPKKPAKYVLETNPETAKNIVLGMTLDF